MYVMISGKIHSRDLGWNNDFGHRKIFSIDFIQIQIFIFKFNVILKVLYSRILGPTKYYLEKNPKFSFPTLGIKIQKLEVWTNHFLLYVMNYESEIIINDKISMISWMRLKVINRTSLFINHSSATRSVDHISLPPQLGGPKSTLTYLVLLYTLFDIKMNKIYALW